MRNMFGRDLSCGMNLLCLLHSSHILICWALPSPTPSSHPLIFSNFSWALWTHSTPLLLFSLHSVPYFRHAFKVQTLPAHLHSFQYISNPPQEIPLDLGKPWTRLSTFLLEIPRVQNLPPTSLTNSPKHLLFMYIVQWNI